MDFIENLLSITKSAIADKQRPIADIIDRIVNLNEGLRTFWSNSHGWAPADAAELMSKSRLDRQVSLSISLRHWIAEPANGLSDGDLILGWTNLGSLLEGSIKLFLSVYYEDYKADLDTLKKTQAWHFQKQKLLAPDGLRLDVLISYVEKAKLFSTNEIEFFKLVQSRRNVVHAFKDNEIGSGEDLYEAIRTYRLFLRDMQISLPYPDGTYIPRED